MKPSVQKILTKLAKEKEKQTNEKLEKVELAKKPQSILSDLNKLDSKMRSQEDKMSKVFNNYRATYKEFVSFMQDAQSTADSLDNDIYQIMNAARELGITDFKSIDGLEEAQDLALRLKDISKSAQKLYPSIS